MIYGNLGGVVWSYQGPRAALDAMGEAIAFCERRGITEMVLQTRSAIPTALAELGHTEQALAEAGPLADRIEAGGDMSFVATRALQVRLLAECGAPGRSPHARSSSPQPAASVYHGFIALAFAAVAQLHLAQGRRAQARTLLQELDELAARVDYDYMSVLPSLMRVALALDDEPLARRLASGVEPGDPARMNTPLSRPKPSSPRPLACRPMPPSSTTKRPNAGASSGTCPSAPTPCSARAAASPRSASPDAEAPLREARELFASMGYKPALAETEALLAETAAAAS